MAEENSSSSADSSTLDFGAILGAFSFVFGIINSKNAAKAAKQISKIEAQRFEIRRQAANKAFLLEAGRLRRKQGERKVQVAVQVDRISAQALARRSLASAAQGSGNVAGQSVQEVLQEFTRQESSILSRLSVFERFAKANIENSIRTARINATITTLNAVPAPTVTPSFTADILQAAGIGLQTGTLARGFFGTGGAQTTQTTTTTASAAQANSKIGGNP